MSHLAPPSEGGAWQGTPVAFTRINLPISKPDAAYLSGIRSEKQLHKFPAHKYALESELCSGFYSKTSCCIFKQVVANHGPNVDYYKLRPSWLLLPVRLRLCDSQYSKKEAIG